MRQAENESGDRAPAELPDRNQRLAVMVALAALAVFLTMRPEPQPVNPDQVATQYLDAAGAQVAAATPEPEAVPTTAPAEAAPATALASTEGSTSADTAAAASEEAAEPTPSTDTAAAGPDTPEASADAPAEPAGNDTPVDEAPATDATDEPSALGGLFSDGFDAERSEWSSMTGDWSVSDGQLVQSNADGFDFINQADIEVPDEYSVTVRMEAVSDWLGGGVVIGQPALGSRRGAYLIDFTAEGTFLRWGRYDPESGAYTYIGGLNVGTSGTGPHTLGVEALTDTTLVYLDDVYIGAFDAADPGYVGLVTSQSAVAFDDFIVDELS